MMSSWLCPRFSFDSLALYLSLALSGSVLGFKCTSPCMQARGGGGGGGGGVIGTMSAS